MADITREPEPRRPRLLALMSNGDAFRADEILAVRVVEDETLVGCERPRFAVMVHLDDGSAHCIACDLARREAVQIARQAAREVNERLLAGGPLAAP